MVTNRMKHRYAVVSRSTLSRAIAMHVMDIALSKRPNSSRPGAATDEEEAALSRACDVFPFVGHMRDGW